MSMPVPRAYLSPTLVLLAYDYPNAPTTPDFLGFSIAREPGFDGAPVSYLPNRIGFHGPDPTGATKGSNEWPIQKFYWWDAHITTADRGATFTYTVTPLHGTPTDIRALEPGASVQIVVPQIVEHGIGSYFNRAVVSSQAFVNAFGHAPTGKRLHDALVWLANGMERAVPDFLKEAEAAKHEIAGAIYHISASPEGDFVIPSLGAHPYAVDLVYHANDAVDKPAMDRLLKDKVTFEPRTTTKIMHDKFLVAHDGGNARGVIMGSANYTTEGLTQQANLMHSFASPELAQLYYDRQRLLRDDPTLRATQAANTGWSSALTVGDATVRAFFPPERLGSRQSLDAIVAAVNNARSSVVFCLFDTTDLPLLDACFAAQTRGLMMQGLVNIVPEAPPQANRRGSAPSPVQVEIYDHSIAPMQLQIVGHQRFGRTATPQGFSFEDATIGGGKFPVFIHHKFVVIDGDTIDPVIFTGSANLSKASTNGNDENLLQITNSPRLAQIYLAEFLRLFEQYRARLAYELRLNSGNATGPTQQSTFELAPDNGWTKKWFAPGTSATSSRVTMARPLRA
ncbi:MAG: phospholipase D-like domain-containing protein [Vulcanimicrobiaceae bacterium]